MDVWIVAAAVGAGYVAQRMRSLSVGMRSWTKWSPETLISVRPELTLSMNKGFDQNSLLRKCLEELYRQRDMDSEGTSNEEVPSTSGLGGQNQSGRDEDCNSEDETAVSQVGVPHDADEVKACELSPSQSFFEIRVSCGYKQGEGRLRSKRISHEFVKPQTSLESCLMAQLCNKDADIQEIACCKHATLSTILLPFLETESRTLSWPVLECSHEPTANDNLPEPNGAECAESVLGIPRLLSIASMKSLVKARNRRFQALTRINITKMGTGDQENLVGSPNPFVLFFLGLTIGLLSSFSGNRREIEKLRKSLKQTESLVEDLQEELDMKDALTVRELYIEDDALQRLPCNACVDDTIRAASNKQTIDCSLRYSNEEQCHQTAEEESFKQIEAELEAELDRLQSDVNPLRLDELYPDSVPDIAEGELRAECFSARDESENYTEVRSSRPTPCSIQYPVSPRLLSLKLHEVIQSRLKDRIKQLEAALEQTKSKITSMEQPEKRIFGDIVERPVVINLPGEALAAYNEELASDEEVNSHQAMFHPEEQEVWSEKEGVLNGYLEQRVVSTDECGSWNQSENGDDEMERLLIQQIVEKARQGSPAVLKAKWALLSSETSAGR